MGTPECVQRVLPWVSPQLPGMSVKRGCCYATAFFGFWMLLCIRELMKVVIDITAIYSIIL